MGFVFLAVFVGAIAGAIKYRQPPASVVPPSCRVWLIGEKPQTSSRSYEVVCEGGARLDSDSATGRVVERHPHDNTPSATPE